MSRRIDLAVFVYNVAVVMSGVAIVTVLEFEQPVGRLAAAVAVGLAWTVYVRLKLIDHLRTIESLDDEDEAETPDDLEETTDAEEEPPIDAPWDP